MQFRILTLSERLSQFAQRGRDQAETLRPGKVRDDLLQRFVRPERLSRSTSGFHRRACERRYDGTPPSIPCT